MTKKRIIILGAGLAGLSAAWHLQKGGKDCLVFEREKEVGGLCSSKKIGGFTFDCDGHLLHFSRSYTFNLVKELLKDNLAEHQRNAAVYLGGRYVHYPFQANFYGLAPSVIKDCLLGSIEASAGNHRKQKNANFLEWINQTFGRGVARHFMIPYNTKFWTVPPQDLTCAWLDGFIPVPSLSQVIEGAIQENQRPFGYNARFWYPKKGGIGALSSALAGQIKNIHTGCAIEEINLRTKKLKIGNGGRERFDCLISTLPLPELSRLIKPLPKNLPPFFQRLRWNSIFNLNLGVETKDCSKRHWIYFPQRRLSFFRVGFFHNFSPHSAPAGKSSLYVEVSYSKDCPINKKGIIPRIKKDLNGLGLVDDEAISVCDINDIEYGYPIYDQNYSSAREEILGFLRKNNIIPCGRYGSWRYMTMEDALLDGREAGR